VNEGNGRGKLIVIGFILGRGGGVIWDGIIWVGG
jgi:hypothetical protein